MSWDFSTEPEFQALLDWMEEFVRDEVMPLELLNLEHEELLEAVAPLQAQVKDRGLWAAHLDPELGGQGFGQVKMGLMNEVLGKCEFAPIAFGAQAPDSGNAEILAIAGTDEQKDRWLRPLLDGEIYSAFSMTEPHTPGSDPTQLQTLATGDRDGWVISGRKWFTSNGSFADFLILMAVTDPDAAPRSRASMFVVPVDTPGVEIIRDVPNMHHSGDRISKYNNHTEIAYNDVKLPADALLGGRGEGFKIAQQRLYPGRIHHCMRWVGQSRRAFDMLCERATYRRADGGEILADKQTIQNWIADSAAEMKAARLMTLEAAWKMDTQGVWAARQDISLIKFFGAKTLYNVIDRALQIHGALGYSGDMPLENMYRTARMARLVDGADEVHRVSVARQILGEYTAPTDEIPSEHIPTRRKAAEQRFAWLLETAATEG
jgi:acyl-CoA dehydrogenase